MFSYYTLSSLIFEFFIVTFIALTLQITSKITYKDDLLFYISNMKHFETTSHINIIIIYDFG